MSEKNEGKCRLIDIQHRWQKLAPDPKNFAASDISDLLELTRQCMPGSRELDNIPTTETFDKKLRDASVQLVGLLAASNVDENLLWAWVWIAASLGERFAGLALAGRLLREAASIKCHDSSRYRRLARSAVALSGGNDNALEELIDSISLESWLAKIKAFEENEPAGQSKVTPIKPTRRDRWGRIKLIQSANGLSVGRRPDDRRMLDQLEILRTGVSFVQAPKDLETIRRILVLEYPWAEEVTTTIFDDLFLSTYSGLRDLHITPTILVGPPACGKTSYAESLSNHLRLPFAILSAAGSADNRFLAGTARGWSSAEPCFPAAFMARTASANPLIFIDELEKASFSTHNGRLQDTLLMMVEPTSARRYLDEFIGLPVDLSNINWMAGANSLNGISSPLQSRFRVIRFFGPDERHFEGILERMKCSIAYTLGVRPDDLPRLDPVVTRALMNLFRSTSDMRRFQRALRAVYAKAGRRQTSIYH